MDIQAKQSLSRSESATAVTRNGEWREEKFIFLPFVLLFFECEAGRWCRFGRVYCRARSRSPLISGHITYFMFRFQFCRHKITERKKAEKLETKRNEKEKKNRRKKYNWSKHKTKMKMRNERVPTDVLVLFVEVFICTAIFFPSSADAVLLQMCSLFVWALSSLFDENDEEVDIDGSEYKDDRMEQTSETARNISLSSILLLCVCVLRF